MLSSLTEPSKGELEVVKRAIEEVMKKLEPSLVCYEVPGSINYLHQLIAGGLGDHYNYYDRHFTINIQGGDRLREGSLRGVESVTLTYREVDCAHG